MDWKIEEEGRFLDPSSLDAKLAWLLKSQIDIGIFLDRGGVFAMCDPVGSQFVMIGEYGGEFKANGKDIHEVTARLVVEVWKSQQPPPPPPF